MKRILRILAITAICGILVTPTVEAQGSRNSQNQVSNSRGGSRGGGRSGGRANSGTPSRNSSPSRPGNSNQGSSSRPGNNNSSRPGNSNPGNSSSRPGNNNSSRPGNSNPGNSSSRPGNNNNRPGNSNPNPGGTRPGNVGSRPGNNPGHSNRPGNNPGPGHNGNGGPVSHHPGHMAPPPPHRPHYATPWAPPRPPRGWHLGAVYPTFTTVLGISFGSSLDLSLSFLYNGGYSVYSYGNDVVYLNNVNQLNLFWPDASLYYGAGGLSRGEFIYSTSYYDTMRYNETYARLVAAYGAPISTSYPSNGMQTCWFGNGGRYVSLQYMPAYGSDGVMRYYTTLSFGL